MSLVVTVQESGGFDLHEESEWYQGTLVEIQETEDRGYGPGLKWIFTLDGEFYDDGNTRETWGFSGQKMTARTKLGKWVSGIRGELPGPGEPVDLNQLIGARVQVMFEHSPGMDRDGNPITRDKVVKVKAARAGEPAPAAPAAVAPEAPPAAPAAPPAPHIAPDEEPF